MGFVCCLLPFVLDAALPPFKQRFIESMSKAVHMVNHGIRLDRTRLINLYQKEDRDAHDRAWLHQMASAYAMPYRGRATSKVWKHLFLRVNTIPASMAIAQAINESNWGRSTFATSGQNYFGIWCYNDGCGVVPAERAPGRHFEVQVFPSMEASVAYYMHLLNTKGAYTQLRQMREVASQEGDRIRGVQLATALDHYSARGSAYIESIQRIIQEYHLQRYDA